MANTPAPVSRPLVLIGLVWLAVAVAAGASGRLARLRPPRPQLILASLTALVLLSSVAVPAFRAWLAALDLRAFVALHLARFVGAYFIILYRAGELPYAFAVPGGIGDILVATGALALLLAVPRLEARTGLLLGWNFLGLTDIFFVVATAARLGLADPSPMAPLLRLPLSLLPTFLVPLIIASHVLIFWRVRRLRSLNRGDPP